MAELGVTCAVEAIPKLPEPLSKSIYICFNNSDALYDYAVAVARLDKSESLQDSKATLQDTLIMNPSACNEQSHVVMTFCR